MDLCIKDIALDIPPINVFETKYYTDTYGDTPHRFIDQGENMHKLQSYQY